MVFATNNVNAPAWLFRFLSAIVYQRTRQTIRVPFNALPPRIDSRF